MERRGKKGERGGGRRKGNRKEGREGGREVEGRMRGGRGEREEGRWNETENYAVTWHTQVGRLWLPTSEVLEEEVLRHTGMSVGPQVRILKKESTILCGKDEERTLYKDKGELHGEWAQVGHGRRWWLQHAGT